MSHPTAASEALTDPVSTDPVAIDLEPHLPLVAHVVRQVALRVPGHVDRAALWRHGAMGLAVAARWNGVGAGFGTLALRAVRAQIVQGLREDVTPPAPAHLARMLGVAEDVVRHHQAPFSRPEDAHHGSPAAVSGPGQHRARMSVEPSPAAQQQRLAQSLRPAWVAVQA